MILSLQLTIFVSREGNISHLFRGRIVQNLLLNLEHMKYIIVGAVAGGASTAARLRRLDEKAEIILFEKGAYISYANCGLPYYIGNVIEDRNKLFVQTAASFNSRFNIDVRVQTEVTAIHPRKKTIEAFDQQTGITYEESYDKLVLSPGAAPIIPPLPGIHSEGIFTLRNVADMDYIKAYITQKSVKQAVVIGAGFIGLEMAENLHELGINVSIVEMVNQVLAPVDYPIAAIAQEHLKSKGIKLFLNAAVTGFEKQGDLLKVNLNTGTQLQAELMLLSIGVKPETSLAVAAGLKIGSTRGIWVNEFLQTSEPDIYAVGDAIEFENPVTAQPLITYLAGPANKQGRICANNLVLGNTHSYKGSVNTSIVKLFDMTIATSGTASKHLKAASITHLVSTTHNASHAGYYPGGKQMTIQLAFSPENGRLYSAQIAGYEGVDKRIDLLSSLIQRKGSIYELTSFEHAYAPPYSSAKDPLNMAGFVAENILLNRLAVFYWDEVAQLGKEELLIDVRRVDEFEKGHIEGALNLPLDELRSRLHELDTNQSIRIYCEAGLRGYLAKRILVQNGYTQVKNLSGGYLLWKTATAEQNALA